MSCPPSHHPACALRALRRQVRMRLWRSRRRLPTAAELDAALLEHLAGAPRLRLAVAHEAARRRLRAVA